MALRKPRAAARVHIPLSGRMFVTCVIWRNEQDMYDGTTVAGPPNNEESIFIREQAGNCIGRIHLHQGRLTAEQIGHETSHAIDWYQERLRRDESRARLVGRCVGMITEAAEDLSA